ncbi:MAG: hypothetical protein FJ102_04550 [Deltaproteobacteria bacterium]|nr:hypothetical protein [Deltaproteobacteria bacterium]
MAKPKSEDPAAPAEASTEASTETKSTKTKKTKKSKKGGKDEEKETELTPIEDCGIESMDTIFREAKDVQTKLEEQRVSLKTARQNAKTALGVGTDAPMSKAFESLQETAGDKLEVVMEGTTPKLKAKDAVPENVQAGIDAVNGLLDASASTVTSVAGLKENAVALVEKSKDFPTQIAAEVKGNPLGAAKASATVSKNIKAIGEIGPQADKLVGIGTRMVADFTEVFGSGS